MNGTLFIISTIVSYLLCCSANSTPYNIRQYVCVMCFLFCFIATRSEFLQFCLANFSSLTFSNLPIEPENHRLYSCTSYTVSIYTLITLLCSSREDSVFHFILLTRWIAYLYDMSEICQSLKPYKWFIDTWYVSHRFFCAEELEVRIPSTHTHNKNACGKWLNYLLFLLNSRSIG